MIFQILILGILKKKAKGLMMQCDLKDNTIREPGSCWASFYLNPEDAEPGLYDFVFTNNGKAVATLLTRFYEEGELEDKSDDELKSIMSGAEE